MKNIPCKLWETFPVAALPLWGGREENRLLQSKAKGQNYWLAQSSAFRIAEGCTAEGSVQVRSWRGKSGKACA
jgi:hypothetical protein